MLAPYMAILYMAGMRGGGITSDIRNTMDETPEK